MGTKYDTIGINYAARFVCPTRRLRASFMTHWSWRNPF